ncbi:unnamed protein product, partial [Musa banksii]
MTAALKAETEEARAEAMKQTLAGLELLEEALARGEASSADIVVIISLTIIEIAYEKVIGLRFVDEKKTPLLVGCAERFCSHEAVKDLMPKGKVSAANRSHSYACIS